MHTHPRHPSGAGQTAGVWDFVIIHYTKYELAYLEVPFPAPGGLFADWHIRGGGACLDSDLGGGCLLDFKVVFHVSTISIS